MHGSFTNENGLRVQKTINGVATKYTLHGKNVVHMTSDTGRVCFSFRCFVADCVDCLSCAGQEGEMDYGIKL